MRLTMVDDTRSGEGCAPGPRPGPGRVRRVWHWGAALTGAAVILSGCGLHVTKHGVSGNAFGHNFSGATGALPTGFPSNVPLPDHSRVLVGGGTNNDWNVTFAVTGSVTDGTNAYQAKVQAAGYGISNVQSGSSPVPAGTGSSSTGTTVTATGSIFTAKNAQWAMQVVAGSTTASTTSGLKPGEFAINITLVPASAATSAT